MVSGRALVLAPHDVARRTLAHEVGHIVGLPDAYLRGYRDRGDDGYEVLELVPNFSDIMASPGRGLVQERHFRSIFVAREVANVMEAGLAALYERNDPNNAVERFREVLERNPQHYGGTVQLAKALDRAERPDEALEVWIRVLEMAESFDTETARAARVRLGRVR